MPILDNGKDATKAGNQQALQQAQYVDKLESMYTQAQLQQMIGAPGQEVAGQGPTSYNLPYPDAPHDGGPQDLANQHAITSQLEGYNAQQARLVSEQPTTGLGLAITDLTLALGTLGIGAAVAAPVAAAVGGGFGGAVAGGAAAGAANGALSASVTGGNIGKGILVGGLTGAIGGGIGSYTNSFGQTISANTGLPVSTSNTISGGLTRTGTGALTGAVGGAINGQGALQGAEAGASHGALNSASGAITGSIFNAGSSIFNSGDAAVPTNDSSLSNPAAPADNASNSNMGASSDYMNGGFSLNDPSSTDGYGSLYDATNSQYDPGNLPTSDPLAGISNPGYDNLNVQGGGSTLGGGYSSGSSGSNSLLSSLARLLTGGGSSGNGSSSGGLASILGGSNGGNGLLAQLLGAGVNGAAGLVNQKAAQGAAQTYANQTAYNPYGVNTSGGSASYGPNGVTTSLSPGSQQTYNGLQGLAQSATNSLQAGPQAAQQQYYNQLQASQQDANNKFFQNNLDSQFANGVLGSTAGQYQSQAALNNISQQGLNDQVAASNYANTQQQNQLQQLTAGLNGVNSINSNQNALASLGGNLGTQASDVNLQAYKPLAGANANSPLGGILSSIGNQYQNGQTTG